MGRGDLLHKTQDVKTRRVALSLRLLDPRSKVNQCHFDESCSAKDYALGKGKPGSLHEAMKRAFEMREEMQFGELLTEVETALGVPIIDGLIPTTTDEFHQQR